MASKELLRARERPLLHKIHDDEGASVNMDIVAKAVMKFMSKQKWIDYNLIVGIKQTLFRLKNLYVTHLMFSWLRNKYIHLVNKVGYFYTLTFEVNHSVLYIIGCLIISKLIILSNKS